MTPALKSLFLVVVALIALGNIALAQQPTSISLNVDAGVSTVTLRGHFTSILSEPAVNIPRNGGADTFRIPQQDNIDLGDMDGSAFRVGLRVAKQVSEHIILSGTVDFLRTAATSYSSTSSFPYIDTAGALLYLVTRSQSASLTLTELDLRPMVRYLPWDSSFFLQGGIAAGMIVAQSASYERPGLSPANQISGQVDSFPRSATSTHVDDTRLQFALILGAGFSIDMTDDISLELGVTGRYGFTPLFQHVDLKSSMSLEAALGLTYRVW